jgi:hypothetical protein
MHQPDKGDHAPSIGPPVRCATIGRPSLAPNRASIGRPPYVLRRTSQQLNLKLREVAERITFTGEVPGAK